MTNAQETASRARGLLDAIDADHAGDDDEQIALYLQHGDIGYWECLRLVQLRSAARDLLAENARLREALRQVRRVTFRASITTNREAAELAATVLELTDAALAGEDTQTGR